MKTVFKVDNNKLVGELHIRDRSSTFLKVFNFDFKSINNWYPLNSEYDLVYQMELDQIQLVPVSRGEILYKNYGIEKFDEKLVQDMSNGLDAVVFEPIRDNNLLVCKKAKDWGMPTWLDNKFEYQEVMDCLKYLDSEMDNATDMLVKSYHAALKSDEKFAFMELSKDNKQYMALKDISPERTALYIAWGKVYTMLNVMRKVSKAYA